MIFLEGSRKLLDGEKPHVIEAKQMRTIPIHLEEVPANAVDVRANPAQKRPSTLFPRNGPQSLVNVGDEPHARLDDARRMNDVGQELIAGQLDGETVTGREADQI